MAIQDEMIAAWAPLTELIEARLLEVAKEKLCFTDDLLTFATRPETIAWLVKRHADELQMPPAKIMEASGIHPSTLSSWTCGVAVPKLTSLIALGRTITKFRAVKAGLEQA